MRIRAQYSHFIVVKSEAQETNLLNVAQLVRDVSLMFSKYEMGNVFKVRILPSLHLPQSHMKTTFFCFLETILQI